IQRDCNAEIAQQMYDMVDFHQCGGIESAVESSMRIYRLFELLLAPSRQERGEGSPLDDAIQYIRAHVGEPLTLGELAAIARLSPCYFSHSFKRKTGFSPLEYVVNTRIERAKVLLARTTKSVAEIAYEVGYSSGVSLSNLFLKRVGVSPRQYRREHQSPFRAGFWSDR
ncbi:MAG: helix-turn-helix domain-containing protein, partial [Butyricicoccus sp.]